ncbi:putative phosphoenolpyruvate synthase regulatory protein [Deinococcus piscis]|uniref:Phosphoenolpyruvate synthase regulatory protein n=2 Tax=Deinococcus piscis TaxID=394230 RepID=A0ABQ3K6M4_9DEIO|nr:putative phosphoenolpyruvate synthase regulatory protein [Deinococcus piscis]
MARALLAHFPEENLAYSLRPFIDSVDKARALADDLAAGTSEQRPLLFTTITVPDVLNELQRAPAVHFDLLSRSVQQLEEELGRPATRLPGRFHDMADQQGYLGRMEALDFALATDDGVGDKQYGLADVILVGVSRAGKTPTSLFLALQHGIRASNYPLAEDDFEYETLPRPLEPYRSKLFGLTIDPQRLHAIRTQRKAGSRYASLEQCEYEIHRAERLYQKWNIPVRDTTSSSVEEIASGILSYLR